MCSVKIIIAVIAEDDDNWKCYVCEPSPLEKMRKECDRVIERVEEAAKKKEELRKQNEQKKKERMEKAKAKASSGKGGTPKKSAASTPQNVTQEIMNQLLAKNKDKVCSLLMNLV